jgi:hypothetical protein
MKVEQAVNLAEMSTQVNPEIGPQCTDNDIIHQSSKDGLGSDDGAALPQVNSDAPNPDASSEEMHSGVRQAEAITQTWSKSSLRTIYLLYVTLAWLGIEAIVNHSQVFSFWLTYAVNAFQSSITGNLTAYVTSGFAEHSLIPVISIVSNVMSAVAYMVLAQILNLWDRSYGYLAMTVLATIGLILSAACTEIYTYCASQVST